MVCRTGTFPVIPTMKVPVEARTNIPRVQSDNGTQQEQQPKSEEYPTKEEQQDRTNRTETIGSTKGCLFVPISIYLPIVEKATLDTRKHTPFWIIPTINKSVIVIILYHHVTS